jgi:hypothetical protein
VIIWVTIGIALCCIVFGIAIVKSWFKGIRVLSLYEIEDIEGYRKYIGRAFITTGIWLLVCVVTKMFITNLDLIKVGLLTVLAVLFEYKIKAGKFMAFDSETGMIKKRTR